jgi:hypothetical protein
MHSTKPNYYNFLQLVETNIPRLVDAAGVYWIYNEYYRGIFI